VQEHHDYTVSETDIDKAKAFAKEKEQSHQDPNEWVAIVGENNADELNHTDNVTFKKQNKPMQNTVHNERNDIIGPKNQFR
jgi:hypothetical protein